MPVSEKFKENIRKRVMKWKERVLAKYPPKGDLEETDLGRFTIIRQLTNETRVARPGGLMKLHLIRTPGLQSPHLVLLTHPTAWDAANKAEMLTHRIEFAIYDRTGCRFTTLVPYYILCGCFGDNAIHIRTTAGEDYSVDHYGCLSTLQYAPHLEFLERRPEIVVRDSHGIRWAAERFGNFQLNIKNQHGDVVIYAEQIPLWKRIFRPPSILLSRMRRLDVSVHEEIPKEVILFLAGYSV